MQAQQEYVSSRRERLTSYGSVVVAFLASQHHSLHMLLMLGASGAGMSTMSEYPAVRRIMLLISLVMAGITAYLLVRRRPPLAHRVAQLVSIVLTLGLLAWSVKQFGL